MQTFIVVRDCDSDIKFDGEEIAFTRSNSNQESGSNYSGSIGHWQELALYRTRGGKYVCSRIDRTQWGGERDSFSGAVCDTEEEVIAFFGRGWLAKDLYDLAGITAFIIEVE